MNQHLNQQARASTDGKRPGDPVDIGSVCHRGGPGRAVCETGVLCGGGLCLQTYLCTESRQQRDLNI